MRKIIGICASILTVWCPWAVAGLTPTEALLFWEIHANPDIHDPKQISTLVFEDMREVAEKEPLDETQKTARVYEVPIHRLTVGTAGIVPPNILKFAFKDGRTARFPVQPDDHHFALTQLGKEFKEVKTRLPIARMASRSTLSGPFQLSFKASVYNLRKQSR